MENIRKLRANEIDVRVGATNKEGTKAILLLYKDARCDMALLDEVFGIGNWQSEYQEIKGVLYCKVGVRASATAKGKEQPLPMNDWVWKQSNGVESQGTGEDDPNNIKGEASDAFKRACFMWGIGRELYEFKNIWIEYDKVKDKYEKFNVTEISFTEDGQPKNLTIVNSKNKTVYKLENGNYKRTQSVKEETPSQDTPKQEKTHTEPKNNVTEHIEEQVTVTKEQEEQIYKQNKEIWKKIVQHILELGQQEEQSPDVLKEATGVGLSNFFENVLKIPRRNGNFIFELDYDLRDPLKKGNIVIAYDLDFTDKLDEYLKKEIFLPF